MQCQTATLNSFRTILMDAQSQGLSLHPLDQQSWLGNMAICNFISMLFSLHPNISLFHPLSTHQHTLFLFTFYSPFFSLSLWLFMSPGPCLCLFLLVRFGCFFFSFLFLSLFWFFRGRCLIKQLQRSNFGVLYLCSHLPIWAYFSCFSAVSFFSFPFFVSLARWLCVYMLSRDWKKPQNKKCGCMRTRMRERECACKPHSPSLPVSAIRVSVAEWIYLLCGYWANDWCCPSKQ